MTGLVKSSVLRTGKSRFDMVGQRLPSILYDTDEKISPGLVDRLHRYALSAMEEAGFDVTRCVCEVYTMDGDDRPADRSYCVAFTNAKGGLIGVQGILTRRGHPCLDHGVYVEIGRSR